MTTARALLGIAGLALVVLLAGVAASGVVAQDDEPGDPVNILGDAVDEEGNLVPVGTEIQAVVDGEIEDTITVEEEGSFGGGEAFDDKLVVNNGAGDEVTFQLGNGATATETLDLDEAGAVEEFDLTFPGGLFLQPDVTGDGNPATDTTGDGLLNDIDGDGEFNIFDVQLFFNNLDESVVQDNSAAFDFNDDGEVDILDVQALFNQLTG